MKIKTRQLAYMALLVALNVVLTRLFSLRFAIGGVEGIRFGLGGLPVILAGILFGPLAGGLVGAFGDVIGYLLSPVGAYMPHFTVSAALTGVIPVLILKLMTQELPRIWELAVAVGIGQLITSVMMVPYFLHVLFGIPYEATLVPAIVGQVISVPVYVGFIRVLMVRLYGVLEKDLIFVRR